MNRNLYSNIEFSKLVERINREVKRRGTFRWWDPFMSPAVGQDRTNAISLPTNGTRVEVTNKTYTINNPSKGSMEETRNVEYEKQGFNPAGQKPDKNKSFPNTSASRFDVDEIKNMLVGLSKIRDISLFYGRDEQEFLAFRDHKGIDSLVKEASKDKLNVPLHESPNKHTKIDPNNGVTDKQNKDYPNSFLEVEFPKENNQYVMPSGEFDGEECLTVDGPNEKNFYDDYGAKPGEINHKSLNPYKSPVVDRSWHDQDDDRNEIYKEVKPGGRSSNRFGETPRNPQKGDPYPSRPVYGGTETTCNNACSGLCFFACDNECSESCTTTCTFRCGNNCTSTCGNVCTGCTTLCYTSCSSKCEQNVGYSCLKAGAKAVHITTSGGRDGIPAKNEITSEIHTCTACSFTCQFYPNKKTECWDSACMGMCFTSCMHSCSSSCFGGCIDNENQNKGDFKTGIGRGCSSGCTANCIGICRGTCVGNCVSSCFHGCQSSCFDNCMRTCSTSCGSGCQSGCTAYCVNLCTSCTGTCSGIASALQTYCSDNGCTMNCMQGCNKNCVGIGCKSICGTESAGACEANCRLSCMNASCTAMCSDQCASYCTSCVNGCNFQCGACSSRCSTGCESACNINCTKECQHSCSINCLNSCKDDCGSCFKAGTMIQTIDGLVPIEEIQIGDKVLTQSGEYHKVIKAMKRKCDDNLIEIHGVGAPTIYTTKDHPFWVKKYIGLLQKNGKGVQLYSDPEWIEAKDLKPRDKWCLYSRSIGNVHIDPGVAYMVGRWLGDGWRTDEISNLNNKSYPRFSICCGKHERVDFEKKLKECEIFTTHRESETAHEYRIPSKLTKHTVGYNNHKLVSILLKCGKRASGKFIPQEIFEWDKESLALLLQGYLDADGHSPTCKYKKFIATSVSKKLLIGISTILRMLGINPGWNIRNNNPVGTILGRTVHIRPSYSIQFRLNPNRKFSFKDDDSEYIWSTVMKAKNPIELYDVYNLTVSEDPTYFADGVLVHNCSSLCYSCVGMCIGVCSVKCQAGCSSCANNCSWWCDTSCNQACFSNCSNQCISTCSGSCATFLTSETTTYLDLPERPPTAEGYKYPHPKNRWEQRESFKLVHDEEYFEEKPIDPGEDPFIPKEQETRILITINKEKNMDVICKDGELDWEVKYATLHGGVFDINQDTGEILINEDAARNLMKQLHFENTDKKQSILAVIIHPKEDYEFTKKDVSHKLPFGYISINSVFLENGDFVSIIQRLRNYL